MKLNVDLIYPIGSVYITTSVINPQVLFGGTWQRIANGKCLVGVDVNDNDFSTVKKTGGEKTHKLTVDEMPNHQHRLTINRDDGGGNQTWGGLSGYAKVSGVVLGTAGSTEVGGDQAHNNLQPYYTVYIWERTA